MSSLDHKYCWKQPAFSSIYEAGQGTNYLQFNW